MITNIKRRRLTRTLSIALLLAAATRGARATSPVVDSAATLEQMLPELAALWGDHLRGIGALNEHGLMVHWPSTLVARRTVAANGMHLTAQAGYLEPMPQAWLNLATPVRVDDRSFVEPGYSSHVSLTKPAPPLIVTQDFRRAVVIENASGLLEEHGWQSPTNSTPVWLPPANDDRSSPPARTRTQRRIRRAGRPRN